MTPDLRTTALEAAALSEKATRAPWSADDSENCWRLHGTGMIIPAQGGIPEQRATLQILKAPKRGTPYAEYWPGPADADLIVHAGTHYATLATALLRLLGENERMRVEVWNEAIEAAKGKLNEYHASEGGALLAELAEFDALKRAALREPEGSGE